MKGYGCTLELATEGAGITPRCEGRGEGREKSFLESDEGSCRGEL